MALSRVELVTLASAALEVVQVRGAQSTALGDRLAAEARMGALLARLEPSDRELQDVIAGVALFHRQQAAAADAWAAEVRNDPGRING